MTRKITLLLLLLTSAIVMAADPWELIVFFNNDRHGGIAKSEATFMNPETPPPLGNFSSETAVIERYRDYAEQTGNAVLVLDQGDFWQGAPVGTLTEGEAVVRAFNRLGITSTVIGNHEFDAGHENVERLIEMAEFPILAGNLFVNEEETELFPGIKPFIIKEFDIPDGKRIKVGIIGITTRDTKGMSLPGNTDVLTVGDEIKYAQIYADSLRKLGVDFVMLSGHMGLPFDANETYMKMKKDEAEQANPEDTPYYSTNYVELAHNVTGIDVAFGGHIHVGYHEPWEDSKTHMMVFQNYAQGSGLGGVKFLFDRETGIFLGYEPLAKNDAIFTLFSDDFWPEPEMEKYIDSLALDAEKNLMKVIAKSEGQLERGDATSNKVGHIVCDAMIEATGSDISIVNMGGIRASLPNGNITRKDVFTVMPFDNKIVNVRMPGRDAMAVIERIAGKYGGALIGGVKVRYNGENPEGERIVSIVDSETGEPIDPDKEYVFSTNDYIFYSYGIPQFTDAPDEKVKFTGILLRTAIEDYLKNHSPISPETDDRWATAK